MITIDNKFEIDEEVFSIWRVPMQNPCSFCEGTGTITYKEKVCRCPQCKGAKILTDDRYKTWEVMPNKLKVYSVKASINGTGVNIKYKASTLNRSERNLFKTIDEAQAACDSLNFVVKTIELEK